MKKILLVEDNETIVMGLKYSLEQENFQVISAKSVAESREKIKQEQIDIVLLDVSLPDGNGFDICKEIKEKQDIPVIFLTAQDEETSVVLGLDLGADDYIAKPFAIEELLARIEVVFRRQDNLNNYIIKFKDITINKSSRVVKRNGNEINLTNKEYELLMILIDNKGKVVTREELLEKIWGYGYEPETNVTDVYIRYLRAKLNNENKEEYIQTVRSVGYIMRS